MDKAVLDRFPELLDAMSRPLEVILSDEEALGLGREYAHASRYFGRLKEDHKDIKARLGVEIRAAEKRACELREAFLDGRAEREVLCVVVPRWDAGVKETVRTDTGEVIAKEALTDKDRQVRLTMGEVEGVLADALAKPLPRDPRREPMVGDEVEVVEAATGEAALYGVSEVEGSGDERVVHFLRLDSQGLEISGTEEACEIFLWRCRMAAGTVASVANQPPIPDTDGEE